MDRAGSCTYVKEPARFMKFGPGGGIRTRQKLARTPTLNVLKSPPSNLS